ncbi:MAG: VTT domain-containing protein [Candidatus Paceibacterota bacterium]|jgi:membrane protein DedA with SNARE-associated domain
MLNGVETLANGHHLLYYTIVFLSAIIIGNAAAFSSFWLALFGYLGRWGMLLTILTVLAADIINDVGWYLLGRSLHDTRFGEWLKKRFTNHHRIEDYIHEGSIKWLFLAKFISSTNAPIVFLAGWAKVNFKEFFKTSLAAIFVWIVGMLGAVYFISSGFIPLKSLQFFKKTESVVLIIIVSVIIFLILNYLAHYLIKKGILKFKKEEERSDQ